MLRLLGTHWEEPELLYIKFTRKEQTLRFAFAFKSKLGFVLGFY